MAQEELDALLERMGAIAKAVNAFSSEAVQHEAFSALITAFHGKHHSPAQHSMAEKDDPPAARSTEKAAPSKRRAATASSKAREARSEWRMVKDLDLNPKGKPSFEDFIKEKDPKSNEDRYPVIVYYLSEILEFEKVTIGHIGAAFRLTKTWKEPTNLSGGLYAASSRKGTIDTKDLDDIKITPTGRNFVEHDLPPKQKATK